MSIYGFKFFNTHLFMRCNNVSCIIISNACRQKPNSTYTESLQLAKETQEFSTQTEGRDEFIFDLIRAETPYETKLCEINSQVDDNTTIIRKQIPRSKKKKHLHVFGKGINQTNKNKKGRIRSRIRTRIRTRIKLRKIKTMKN